MSKICHRLQAQNRILTKRENASTSADYANMHYIYCIEV